MRNAPDDLAVLVVEFTLGAARGGEGFYGGGERDFDADFFDDGGGGGAACGERGGAGPGAGAEGAAAAKGGGVAACRQRGGGDKDAHLELGIIGADICRHLHCHGERKLRCVLGCKVMRAEQIDLVGREHEFPVRRHEGEFAGDFFPMCETHALVEDGVLEEGVWGGAETLLVRGGGVEGDEEVGCARELGGEGNGAVGTGCEGASAGGDGRGYGLDHVDVHFVAGVLDVGAAPWDGGDGGGLRVREGVAAAGLDGVSEGGGVRTWGDR